MYVDGERRGGRRGSERLSLEQPSSAEITTGKCQNIPDNDKNLSKSQHSTRKHIKYVKRNIKCVYACVMQLWGVGTDTLSLCTYSSRCTLAASSRKFPPVKGTCPRMKAYSVTPAAHTSSGGPRKEPAYNNIPT